MREFLIKSRNLTEPDLTTQNRAHSTERQTIQLTKRFLAETIKAPAVNYVSPGSPQVEPVNVPPVEQINLPPPEITPLHGGKTLPGSESGEKMLRESRKRFPRPDPEKHFGYRIILLKAGKQCQTEEETNEAKDPVASKEALMRVAQAEALEASKASRTQKDKNDWMF
ncbi:Uncharacterized protein APZ42_032221 [Daphnia magna]|uniref:Uncharacterized protein n=1 Tax=Daphnia magna TaxID=35525 RepID=A0A164M645_9CRUS|nr:Uncharacterized protein APZ42_032221 [Daphnia magna]